MLYSPNTTTQDYSFVPHRKFNLANKLCPIFFLPHPPKCKCTLVLRTSTSGASSELHGGLCNKIRPPDSNSSDLWRTTGLIINFTVLLISARNGDTKDSFCLVRFFGGEGKKWNPLCVTTQYLSLSSCVCQVLLCTTAKHKHTRLHAISTSERTKPI